MTPELKVCGVRDASFAVAAARLGAGYEGFIFAAASPRRVSPELARRIRRAVLEDPSVAAKPRFVGVFAGEGADEIEKTADAVPLDVIQLHGGYGAEDVRRLRASGREVWILDPGDAGATPAEADAVLVDGRDGRRTGGTGRLADWSRVAGLKAAGRRVVLAGGLSAGCVEAAAATGADVLDVNSGVEIAPGVKSAEMFAELAARLEKMENWWTRRDLNPRPGDYESPALTD